MQNLTISPLSALPQVWVLGRCAGTDPLTLFWTGSGIELLFTGSELWVELNADYDTTWNPGSAWSWTARGSAALR